MICDSVESLKSELQANRHHADNYFDAGIEDWTKLIVMSVSGSTFRAYTGDKKVRPSLVFRSWCRDRQNSLLGSHRLKTAVRSRGDFETFHAEVCNDLEAYWSSYEPNGSRLDFGKTRKLVDLFLKHLIRYERISDDVRSKLRSLTHVPLDKYTIKHLSGISEKHGFDGLASIKLAAKTWSMGYINDENGPERYELLQDIIREAAKVGGVDPIDYDILAWNLNSKAARSTNNRGDKNGAVPEGSRVCKSCGALVEDAPVIA
jgi:hypothetical protein